MKAALAAGVNYNVALNLAKQAAEGLPQDPTAGAAPVDPAAMGAGDPAAAAQSTGGQDVEAWWASLPGQIKQVVKEMVESQMAQQGGPAGGAQTGVEPGGMAPQSPPPGQ